MQQLAKVIDLFHLVMNDAYQEADENKHQISSIYMDAKKKIQKVMKSEKTIFLTYPIMEYGFRKCMELYTLHAADVVSGQAKDKLDHIIKLKEELDHSAVKLQWDDTSKKIRDTLLKAKLPYTEDGLKDMAELEDVIYQALLFFDKDINNLLKEYKVRDGKKGEGAVAYISHIGEYKYPSELVDALEKAPQKRVIAFGAIIPTFGMTEDLMMNFTCGFPDTRITNWSRNNNMSVEELRVSDDNWRAYIAIGIKDGERVYFLKCSVPHELLSNETFELYDKVMTYLPIQVLFLRAAQQPESKEKYQLALSNAHRYWDMRKILSTQQSVWLSIVYKEIADRYFGTEINIPLVGFSEEQAVILSLPGMSNLENHQEMENYGYQLPQVRHTLLLSLEDINLTDFDRQMIYDAGVDMSCFRQAPIGFVGQIMTYVVLRQKHVERLKTVVWAALRDRLLFKLYDELIAFQELYIQRIMNREAEIMELILYKEPLLATSVQIHFNGEICRRLDGSESFGFPLKTEIIPNDCSQDQCGLVRNIPETLRGKRPPVSISIMPKTIKALELIMGMKRDEMGLIGKYYAYLHEDLLFPSLEQRKSIFSSLGIHNRWKYLRLCYSQKPSLEYTQFVKDMNEDIIKRVLNMRTSEYYLTAQFNMGKREFKHFFGNQSLV